MSPFEFVVVLISIIIGLGITTILTGVAEIIRSGIRPCLPYAIWIVLSFTMHIHEWWQSYQLRSIEVWTLPLFLLLLIYPIVLYILAHVLFPSEKGRFDSNRYYLEQYPRFFTITIVMVVISMFQNIFISQLPAYTQIVHLVVLALLGILLKYKPQRLLIHSIVAMILLSLMVASLIFTQDDLVIR